MDIDTEARLDRLERRMRRSRRRYAALVGLLAAALIGLNIAPVAANHLKVTTSDLTKGAVTTAKIKNQAVTTKKLKKNAVKTGKIASGAITGTKLAAEVPGVAVAGANVQGNGTNPVIRGQFNRVGGPLTVVANEEGFYQFTMPGGSLTPGAIIVATGSGANARCNVFRFSETQFTVQCMLNGTTQLQGANFSVVVMQQ
ncbi:hypothetical protein [Nocardioides limicola]|uniref:hypothetical protein n=1 Tax=Nocardioides limicola TaxID=2803368 RepID=UPI00193B9A4B|nr:hypothetical protein [Nocardioides sp. DJM-14]